jgi:hypothetical protein
VARIPRKGPQVWAQLAAAIEEAAAQTGRCVAVHVTGEPGALYAVQAGIASVDHACPLSDQAMRESLINAAAIKVDDAIVLSAGKDHREKSRGSKKHRGLQGGIAHSAPGQIVNCFGITVQLKLIEGGGERQQLGRGGQFFLQVGDAVAKGEMQRQFGQANQVTAPPAAVTIDQILARVDVDSPVVLRCRSKYPPGVCLAARL